MALSDPEQQRFEELFGAAPEFSSFASGRVNLIG
jgi:galactokinase